MNLLKDLKQIYFGELSSNLSLQFKNYTYTDIKLPTLFVRIHSQKDIDILDKHIGKKYIIISDTSNCHLKTAMWMKSYITNAVYFTTDKNIQLLLYDKLRIKSFLVNLKEILQNLSKSNINYFILTNNKLHSIADNIHNILSSNQISSKIIYKIDYNNINDDDIYIIIYVKYFTELKNKLPKKYIFYQMEQKASNMINNTYFNIMNKAYKIFEFSFKNNFYRKNINVNNLYFTPFPLYPNVIKNNSKYDILFYGQFNKRRLTILNKLKEKYNIQFFENLLNERRDSFIKECKIVINIHFYDNSSLETCRINECLKYNKVVISEDVDDPIAKKIYNNCVFYFDKIDDNYSNIDSIFSKINWCLNNYDKIVNNMNINKIYEFTKNKFLNNLTSDVKSSDKDYFSLNDIESWIKLTNKNSLWIIESYNKLINESNNNNLINIDHYFYKCANNIKFNEVEKILKHLYDYGIEEGLIYDKKQLQNIFPDIKIVQKNNNIYVKYENIYSILSDFVKYNVYLKNYKYFLDSLIILDNNNINSNKDLFILTYIGNSYIGNKLAYMINNYKKIQDFNLCIIYHKDIDINKIKQVFQFSNIIYYKSNDFGNDIIPTILAFDKIKTLFKFRYVTKLHTKGNEIWFKDLTSFLLSKTLNQILKLKNNQCNCISHDKYYYHDSNKLNYLLLDKYSNLIDNKKLFVRGTIFFSEYIVFDNVLNFIKDNFRTYLFNNMYDTNMIIMYKSPVHFIERLFGIIKIS